MDKEETYITLSQHDHVLKRPGMYIGSVNVLTEENFLINESDLIEKRTVTVIPGLMKIFDEILVNAIDHSTKCEKVTDIKVVINSDFISVYNNGPGIPVTNCTGVYTPEIVFGTLLTSSSFDDNQEKITGGINGLGAKLTNIYSTKFIVETVDSNRKLHYIQTFEDNMRTVNPPAVKKYTKVSFTKITFYPDFKKFGLQELTSDIISVMKRRVYDISACTNKKVKVSLNGVSINIKDFIGYTSLYFIDRKPDAYEKIEFGNYMWEIAAYRSEQFSQVSFVNGINTHRGGKHVDYVLKQISKKLLDMIASKKKIENLKQRYIEDHLFLFVKATINQPEFDSQTKDTLKTPTAKFFPGKEKIDLSEAFIKKLYVCGITEDVIRFTDYKNKTELAKVTTGSKKLKITGIPKLDDAKYAGTSKSNLCSLFIVEGDSAKTFAVSGVSEINEEYYGIFPVRGKILNVREATHKQQLENVIITDLIKILGLVHSKVYTNTKDLRYGSIIILTDSDVDGIHIRGLLLNVFSYWWPSILQIDGFIKVMATPLIKIFLKGKPCLDFYNERDYMEYSKNNSQVKGTVKYYKGLGTSTASEAKEIFRNTNFSNKEKNKINLASYNTVSIKETQESMSLAFDKNQADARKEWILSFKGTSKLGINEDISVSQFINCIFVLFSLYDNVRSIPSALDGLKPSQRKILFTMFKENYKKEIKVAQLGARVAEVSGYHHGEASLFSTITGMAQNYTGSNNWNLLKPNGQFGTRLQLGKDSASPRYIFTELSEYSDRLFNRDDLNVLDYIQEEGVYIEPTYYMPILPLVLINGTEGIGTGFSTKIPCFNPEDIISNIKSYLQSGVTTEMTPWYHGFTGKIIKTEEGSFNSYGTLKLLPELLSIKVTEIPINCAIQDYKEYYESLVDSNEYGITGMEYRKHTEDINFVMTFKTTELYIAFVKQPKEKIIKLLKLSKSISTRNMHLFDKDSKIRKFDTAEEILKYFVDIRLIYNVKRKNYMIAKIQADLLLLSNKVRFLEEIMSGGLTVFKIKKDALYTALHKKKFDLINGNFSYLTDMSILAFTYEMIDKLKETVIHRTTELQSIQRKTAKSLLLEDLQ